MKRLLVLVHYWKTVEKSETDHQLLFIWQYRENSTNVTILQFDNFSTPIILQPGLLRLDEYLCVCIAYILIKSGVIYAFH
jgi:hypothetical protein